MPRHPLSSPLYGAERRKKPSKTMLLATVVELRRMLYFAREDFPYPRGQLFPDFVFLVHDFMSAGVQ